MDQPLRPALRDCLVRFQRQAIKETGRRPLCVTREPMDTALVVPGCQRPGFAFWQPMPWGEGQPELGESAKRFHPMILEYLSTCQMMEMRFTLPVATANSPLAFLHGRVFETFRNTLLSPPKRALDDAALESELGGEGCLAFCLAATCDAGEPVCLSLDAQTAEAMILHREQPQPPLRLKLTLDRLLPKLQFVYELQ